MRSISISLILLAAISCSTKSPALKSNKPIDTVVIDYQDSKDTLIILDTVTVVKKNAKNLWTPKCVAYRIWRQS